jgi:hypothetical protein
VEKEVSLKNYDGREGNWCFFPRHLDFKKKPLEIG